MSDAPPPVPSSNLKKSDYSVNQGNLVPPSIMGNWALPHCVCQNVAKIRNLELKRKNHWKERMLMERKAARQSNPYSYVAILVTKDIASLIPELAILNALFLPALLA